MKNIRHLAVMAMIAAAAIMASGCFAGSRENDTGLESGSYGESAAGQTGVKEQTGEEEEASVRKGISNEKEAAPVLTDNFYYAVNHDILAGWEIPSDQADMGWFRITREKNQDKMDALIRQVSSQADLVEGSDLFNIRALNLTGLDREARDRGGYGQFAGAFLEELEKAGNVQELLETCLRFQRDYGIYSLVGFIYSGDSEHSSEKSLYLGKPDTGLNREVWFSEDAASRRRVEEYKKCLVKLHEKNGVKLQEAEKTVEQVMAMMKDLASSSLRIEETYDAGKTNNVYKAQDAVEIYSDALPFSFLKEIYDIGEDEKMVVGEPDVCRKLGAYLKDENLPLLKAYVKTCLYTDLAMVTDTASLDAAQKYRMAVNGTKEKKPFGRTVSETVQSELGFQCGRLYCEAYFDDEAKQDVTDMIHRVTEVYGQRLEAMEWMTKDTRREAGKKLASIMVKVGYPDQWPQDRYGLKLKEPGKGGLYVDNILTIKKAVQDDSFQRKNDPVDRTEWGMTPQTVNAYYNPGNNEIVFPAGILQPPFYDALEEPAVNLGRIGAVIGHEITHAFDTSGSQYDEKGNLRDWWTAGDKKRFQELAQKVIDYYDAMEVNGIKVNGKLCATENIADLGAVACITEIAKQEGYDLKELYQAYAVLWAGKYRDEYLSYLMANDTHAPGMIRVNAVLSATDDFYTAFDVKEGDGMYREPENRPKIW